MIREEFAQAVAENMPDPAYSQTHGATVVIQREDDTLDLDVDDERIGSLLAVPFRIGIPGARVLLAEGARVRVAFESGDPSKHYAFAPDADPAATRGVALEGHEVDLGTLSVSGGGGVAFVWTPPGGVPSMPTTSVALRGVIAEGSLRLRLADV